MQANTSYFRWGSYVTCSFYTILIRVKPSFLLTSSPCGRHLPMDRNRLSLRVERGRGWVKYAS